MSEELQDQAPEVPVAPAPEAEPTQAVDYAVIEAELSGLGDGYSLQTAAGKIRDLQGGMGRAQKEAAGYKSDLAWANPLKERLHDRDFAEHMNSAVQEWDSRGNEPAGQNAQARPDASLSFDQNQIALTDVRTELALIRQKGALDDLGRKYPDHMNEDVHGQILDRIAATGNGDVKTHFLAIKGRDLLAKAEVDGFDAGVASAKKRQPGYVQPRSHGATTPASKPVAEMNPQELDAHQLSRIAALTGGG